MQIIVICNMAIKCLLYLMQNKSEHLFMLFELSVEPHRVGDALATPRAVTRWSAVIPALPLSPCRPTDRSHYNQLAALSSGLIKDLEQSSFLPVGFRQWFEIIQCLSFAGGSMLWGGGILMLPVCGCLDQNHSFVFVCFFCNESRVSWSCEVEVKDIRLTQILDSKSKKTFIHYYTLIFI